MSMIRRITRRAKERAKQRAKMRKAFVRALVHYGHPRERALAAARTIFP